jgi:PAS domain S-box-containing protein
MQSAQQDLKSANILLENKIREASNAQSRLHLLLEYASEVISIYDESIRLQWISPSVINIFGYTVEEMMGGKDMERIGREDVIRIRKMLEELKETPGRIGQLDYSFIKRTGNGSSCGPIAGICWKIPPSADSC